jgi:hypothetical protein
MDRAASTKWGREEIAVACGTGLDLLIVGLVLHAGNALFGWHGNFVPLLAIYTLVRVNRLFFRLGKLAKAQP